MTSAAARYARLNVPRYTSYPTAASFTDGIAAHEQRAWLADVSADVAASVYLHVPFCRELCHYCGCNTKAARRDDVIASYRAALETEIARVASVTSQPRAVKRLHWGGGTPSILNLDGIESVIATLTRWFDMSELREHAIELDPRYVTAELAGGLAALGVDRASLGVQDIDPGVQDAIGRRQPFEVVASAVTRLRAAGIDRINFDLIYGLPRQTAASLRATCEAVADLAPDRIAYFGYAHVPSLRANQRRIDSAQLPGSDDRMVQSRIVGEILESWNYVKVGIDHFARADDAFAAAARQGRLRRNFQGYTDDGESVLLGFGASAISRLPQGYVQNVSDPRRYVATITNGQWAGTRGIALTAHDWTRARIIESLMCDFGVDLASVAPRSEFAEELRVLRRMAEDGLVEIDRRAIEVTPVGRPLVRVIAAVFDQHLGCPQAVFSAAV